MQFVIDNASVAGSIRRSSLQEMPHKEALTTPAGRWATDDMAKQTQFQVVTTYCIKENVVSRSRDRVV